MRTDKRRGGGQKQVKSAHLPTLAPDRDLHLDSDPGIVLRDVLRAFDLDNATVLDVCRSPVSQTQVTQRCKETMEVRWFGVEVQARMFPSSDSSRSPGESA